MKLEFSRQIFKKKLNTSFRGNPSNESRVVPYGRTKGRTEGHTYTYVTEITVTFRNFTNMPKSVPERNSMRVCGLN